MKKYFILLMMLVMVMLVGCGKKSKDTNPKDIIPDPYEYFDRESIALITSDDRGIYYKVKNVTEDDYYNYMDICVSDTFTNIEYQSNLDNSILLYTYDEDHNYRLELTMNKSDKYISIICNAEN